MSTRIVPGILEGIAETDKRGMTFQELRKFVELGILSGVDLNSIVTTQNRMNGGIKKIKVQAGNNIEVTVNPQGYQLMRFDPATEIMGVECLRCGRVIGEGNKEEVDELVKNHEDWHLITEG